MLDLFENKHVGEIPAPFYLDQQQVDQIARILREHQQMLDLLSYIEKWEGFPVPEKKIGTVRGPKAQIEHMRSIVRDFIDARPLQNDK